MLERTVSQQFRSCLAGTLSWDSTRSLRTGTPRPSTVPLLHDAGSQAPALPNSQVLPFLSIPSTGRNAWVNLFRSWRNNSFQQMHHVMEKNFQQLGPIYRENLGTHSSVNILHPKDVARLFRAEGVFPRRMRIEAWAAHRDLRNYKCGVFLLNGEAWRSDRLILNKEVLSLSGVRKFLPFLDEVAGDFVSLLRRRINKNTRGALTVDLNADLFRFTMEASGYVLYGQRLGLLEEHPNAESLRFIRAVETMIKTTLPLLFLPPKLLRLADSHLWTEHVNAWDIIFQQADRCIQNIYQEFCLKQERGYSGIMAELLLQAELPLDSIKANITELMAGGVDT
ncbi:cytochrome P450 11B, mitochondrial-like, partial [Ascaphus truei]|uniref:cytochrome P450 11B, mitochondrial-like n=1 Tax=Ascaphus truei TaxID=8439 RepID=UPI003F5A65D7